jgi:ABC-type multidrug transport system permease subunit
MSTRETLGALGEGLRIQLRMSSVTPLAAASSAVTPAAYGIAVASGFGEPSAALLLGTVATVLWGAVQTDVAVVVVQERSWGTLQVLAAGPTPLAAPLVGRLLGSVAQGLLTVPLAAGAVIAIFGVPPDVPWARGAAALLVVLAGLLGMGLVLMGALARYRYSAGMVNGLFVVVLLLAGFFVPLASLPPALEVAGRLLPPAWAVDAVRAGATHPWRGLGLGAALALLWLTAGATYLVGAERRLRRLASAYHH